LFGVPKHAELELGRGVAPGDGRAAGRAQGSTGLGVLSCIVAGPAEVPAGMKTHMGRFWGRGSCLALRGINQVAVSAALGLPVQYPRDVGLVVAGESGSWPSRRG
jgi:hypothetical protein